MKGFLYIAKDKIGEIDFSVIDESMGVIGGTLHPNTKYMIYQSSIQKCYEQQGVANINQFNFRVVFEDNSVLNPEGGIGVTDAVNCEDIYVEAAGLDIEVINKIR